MKNCPKLHELSFEDYKKAKASGVFWVYYPEATGNYEEDVLDKNDPDSIFFNGKNPQESSVEPYDYYEAFGSVSSNIVENTKEHTGKSVNYYRLTVEEPTSEDIESYTAECNDIIEGLNMTYAEANVFKAIWRKCAERELGLGKEGNNQVYDAEKMVFFSERTLKIDLKKKD